MTGVSTLGQSLDQIERLKTLQSQLSNLTMQLTTGKKSQTFSGLGDQVMTTQRSRTSLKDIDTYSDNIAAADRRLKMMADALGEIKRQGNILLNSMQGQSQGQDFDVESVSDLAGKIRDFVNELVNQKDGDRYIFGGTETLTPPLQDNGLMDSYLQSKIQDWTDGTISTDSLIDTYRDTDQLSDTTVGYSAVLSSGGARQVTARLDVNKQIQYGPLANDSGIRDIIAAAGLLENLGKVMDSVATDPDGDGTETTAPGADAEAQRENFFSLFNDITKLLTGGLHQVENLESDVAQSQVETGQAKSDQTAQKNVLLSRLDDIESVDLNEVAVQLQSLQVQIEASYRMTSAIKDLNLSNFLPI